MNIKQEAILDTATSDGCFSIRKQNYIDLNGQKTYVGLPVRRAFCPGQFNALAEYAPEFEIMANAIWTKEAITAWQQKQVEQGMFENI